MFNAPQTKVIRQVAEGQPVTAKRAARELSRRGYISGIEDHYKLTRLGRKAYLRITGDAK